MSRDAKRSNDLFVSAARAFQQTHWQPAVDVCRTARGWLLKYELAGVLPTDIQLSVAGRTITLRGARRDIWPCALTAHINSTAASAGRHRPTARQPLFLPAGAYLRRFMCPPLQLELLSER